MSVTEAGASANRKAVVAEMLDAGAALADIAKATGMTVGGVKATVAYMGLRRPAKASRAAPAPRLPYAGYDPHEPRWGTPSCFADEGRA